MSAKALCGMGSGDKLSCKVQTVWHCRWHVCTLDRGCNAWQGTSTLAPLSIISVKESCASWPDGPLYSTCKVAALMSDALTAGIPQTARLYSKGGWYLEGKLESRCKLGHSCQPLQVKQCCLGSLPSQQALPAVQILHRVQRRCRRWEKGVFIQRFAAAAPTKDANRCDSIATALWCTLTVTVVHNCCSLSTSLNWTVCGSTCNCGVTTAGDPIVSGLCYNLLTR